jgi:Lon protease-like protein
MSANRIPLFPLGLVLLPGMPLPLHIFEDRYKRMIGECLSSGTEFGIVWFDGRTLHSVGCTARIVRVLRRYDDGRMDILVLGDRRFATERTIEEKPYLEADVAFIDDTDAAAADAETLRRVRGQLRQLEEAESGEGADEDDPYRLSFAIPAIDGFTLAERQRILEMTSAAERLRVCAAALGRIIERARLTRQLRRIIGGNGHPPVEVIRTLATGEEDEG